MKKIVFIMMLLLSFLAKGQIITTVAGTGSNLFTGDSGPATIAGIPDPTGGVFDKQGNFYFADALGVHRVRKINPSGIITTIAGNGVGGYNGDGISATSAKLNLATTVTIDTFGNIYICDDGNNRIRKVDKLTGTITTVAGNGVGSFGGENVSATLAQLWNPQDICFDKFGNLYIADGFNYRVRKVNPLGIITTFAGTGITGSGGDAGPATLAQLWFPTGVAADDTGNIYIADLTGNVIRKVNTAGIITTFAGNGTGSFIADEIPAVTAQINPGRIAFDTGKNLFVADKYNNRIYKIDLVGIIHTVCGTGVAGDGGDGGPATSAQIYTPTGIAFDPCNNLYIPTAGSSSVTGSGRRIRKITFNSSCTIPELNANTTQETSIFSIFPNPAYSSIAIIANTTVTNISVTNIFGTAIFSYPCHTQKIEINIANLLPGMYLLRAKDIDGNITVKKILKE